MKVLVKDYDIEDLIQELRDVRSRIYDSEIEGLIDKLLMMYDTNSTVDEKLDVLAISELGKIVAQDVRDHSVYLYDMTIYDTEAIWYEPETGCIFTDVEYGASIDRKCDSLVIRVNEYMAEKYIKQIYAGVQEKAYPCVRYRDDNYVGGLEWKVPIYFAELVAAIKSE